MKIHKGVEELLEESKKYRENDDLLYLEMCKRANPVVAGMSFSYVLENARYLGLPDRETVRRARQRIQHDREDLRAVGKVDDARYKKFKEMRSYAAGEIEI